MTAEITNEGKKMKVRIRTQGTTTMNWKPPATLGESLRFAKRHLELEEAKLNKKVEV